jgi:hypothetical protein
MSRIVPLPTTNTVVDNTVTIINADGSVASFASLATALPASASRIPSAANSTNPTSAKATAGRLFSVSGLNATATVTYLKFYNKASAPTVGTDTPVLTLALPALSAFNIDLGGFVFSTGIAYGLTTDAADAGTTVVAAGAILGLNVVYA